MLLLYDVPLKLSKMTNLLTKKLIFSGIAEHKSCYTSPTFIYFVRRYGK